MGGKVTACDHREYGYAKVELVKTGDQPNVLFQGLGDDMDASRCAFLRSFKLTME